MIGRSSFNTNTEPILPFVVKSHLKAEKNWRLIKVLFRISAILPVHNFTHLGITPKVVGTFNTLFNILLILHHSAINASLLKNSPSSARCRANIAMTAAALVHRWVVSIRASCSENTAKRIAKLSRKLDIRDDKQSLFRLWTVSSTLTYCPIFVSGVAICCSYGAERMIFNYSIEPPILEMIFMVAYMGSWTLFLTLPINSFDLYYSITCRQLQCIVVTFKNSLDATPSSKYHLIFRQYMSIRKLVERVDSELSLPVFTSTLFNACTMFFAVISVLHADEFGGPLDLFTVWALFLVSYSGFLGVAVTGSLVSESADEVWSHAQDVLVGDSIRTCAQKQFLAVAEKGLHMTCWKIAPVRRSFVLVTMGTVLTYCFLLDNLRPL